MKITVKKPNQISTVLGTPGPEGPPGPPGLSRVSLADDVNITNLNDGSILIYSTLSEKWIAGTELIKQSVECGEY